MDAHFQFLLKNLKIWHHYTGKPAWPKLAKYLLFLSYGAFAVQFTRDSIVSVCLIHSDSHHLLYLNGICQASIWWPYLWLSKAQTLYHQISWKQNKRKRPCRSLCYCCRGPTDQYDHLCSQEESTSGEQMYFKDNVSGAINLLAQFTKTEGVLIVWT